MRYEKLVVVVEVADGTSREDVIALVNEMFDVCADSVMGSAWSEAGITSCRVEAE